MTRAAGRKFLTVRWSRGDVLKTAPMSILCGWRFVISAFMPAASGKHWYRMYTSSASVSDSSRRFMTEPVPGGHLPSPCGWYASHRHMGSYGNNRA